MTEENIEEDTSQVELTTEEASVEPIAPKRRVGRPTREEAEAKRRKRAGRPKGSKTRNKAVPEKDEFTHYTKRYAKEALQKIATFMNCAASESIRFSAAKELLRLSMEAMYNKGVFLELQEPQENETRDPHNIAKGKIVEFPFAVK